MSRGMMCKSGAVRLLLISLVTAALLLLVYTIRAPPPLCSPESSAESGRRPLSKFKVVHSAEEVGLYVHSAVLDERFNRSVVRVFALAAKDLPDSAFSCRWAAPDASLHLPVLSSVPAQRLWIDRSWPHWSPYFACEFDCAVPTRFDATEVTLVGEQLEFTLPVERFPKRQKKDVAICLKPQTGSPRASRLIEWFEMARTVGIEDIIVYNGDTTGPSRFVFEYYQDQGVAKLISFPFLLSVLQKLESPKLTGEDRYAIYQQIYLIAMHDCLYRFGASYKYLLYLDTDEVITPSGRDQRVPAILAKARGLFPSAAGYMFLTAWHWEESGEAGPKNGTYMQRYTKATPPLDNQPKSAIATDRAITLNFHEVLDVPHQAWTSEMLPWESFAYIHHFRGKCSNKFKADICKDMLGKAQVDHSISWYVEHSAERIRAAREHLQLE